MAATMMKKETKTVVKVPAARILLWGNRRSCAARWVLYAAGLLSACSPSLNWRTWSANETPLQALIPCKPDVAQRTVKLGEASANLHLHSCDNDGLRYALAWVVVPPALDAKKVMAQWHQASARSLNSQQPGLSVDGPPVRGASHTAWWQLKGQDHRGQVVLSQVVYFTDGQRVYQAAVYGQPWDELAIAPFWEGLKLP